MTWVCSNTNLFLGQLEHSTNSAGTAGIWQPFGQVPPSQVRPRFCLSRGSFSLLYSAEEAQLKGDIPMPALSLLSLARTLQIPVKLMGRVKPQL